MSPYHVKVAAEAFAAGMFAQVGCDVSVQYGADQPGYDLIVARDERLVKVSVKGSQDGRWGLTQSFLSNANYKAAIDDWLACHDRLMIMCLVQFKGVTLGACPRVYLARPHEVANALRSSCKGRGDTILRENHTYVGGRAAGTTDSIPPNWKFSLKRLMECIAPAPEQPKTER